MLPLLANFFFGGRPLLQLPVLVTSYVARIRFGVSVVRNTLLKSARRSVFKNLRSMDSSGFLKALHLVTASSFDYIPLSFTCSEF